jgi:hypothetical protein
MAAWQSTESYVPNATMRSGATAGRGLMPIGRLGNQIVRYEEAWRLSWSGGYKRKNLQFEFSAKKESARLASAPLRPDANPSAKGGTAKISG